MAAKRCRRSVWETWLTFDVDDHGAIRRRREVLRRFLAAGGGMIDSSPMYGRGEWLLEQLPPGLPHAERLFAATRIWTLFDAHGPRRLEARFFLKRITAHPAVTRAIPATSNPEHMDENMGSGLGRLPDVAMRRRMRDYFSRL